MSMHERELGSLPLCWASKIAPARRMGQAGLQQRRQGLRCTCSKGAGRGGGQKQNWSCYSRQSRELR